MARIQYLKHAPGAKPGDVRSVDAQSARVLTRLGFARLNETRVIEPEVQPSQVAQDEPVRKKRQYRRRDIQAK